MNKFHLELVFQKSLFEVNGDHFAFWKCVQCCNQLNFSYPDWIREELRRIAGEILSFENKSANYPVQLSKILKLDGNQKQQKQGEPREYLMVARTLEMFNAGCDKGFIINGDSKNLNLSRETLECFGTGLINTYECGVREAERVYKKAKNILISNLFKSIRYDVETMLDSSPKGTETSSQTLLDQLYKAIDHHLKQFEQYNFDKKKINTGIQQYKKSLETFMSNL